MYSGLALAISLLSGVLRSFTWENPEIVVGKSNDLRHSVWGASKTMTVI